jgi:hypothetical protein
MRYSDKKMSLYRNKTRQNLYTSTLFDIKGFKH